MRLIEGLIQLTKCPSCGNNIEVCEKEWEYGHFHVKMCLCGKCGLLFKAYFRGEKLSHTIPKFQGIKAKVMKYLGSHENGTIEKIANDLSLDCKKVQQILAELQSEGYIVETTKKEDV